MVLGFYTLGCKLNQSETETLAERFQKKGFSVFNLNVETPKKPLNYICINSCAVTEQASLKSLRKIKAFKKLYPAAKIVFFGCLAAIEEEKIKKWGADFVFQDKEKLFSFIVSSQKEILPNSLSYYRFHTRYFLKIQEGCSNFCTYCIIPYTRGFEEKSRPPREILEEIKAKNPKEIVLCGINIGHYKAKEGGKTFLLPDLIKKILKETDVFRIRISSINPEDVGEDLISLMKNEKRMALHLHLSLQSGSNKILKKMNRHYTAEDFYNLVSSIKKEIPDFNLTGDVIVGFPSETEKDFQETIDLISKVGFLKLHVFPFSPRPKTPAFLMQNQISPSVKKERVKILKEIEKKISQEVKKNYLFRDFEVLFEEKRGEFFSGFTSNYLKVYTKSKENLADKIKKVTLKKLFKDGFLGE